MFRCAGGAGDRIDGGGTRSMWIMWMNVWAGNRQMVWLVERGVMCEG